MWFLLGGRVRWRKLVPCAVATGAFWRGMLVVFHFIFSGMVISYDQKYGPTGIIFALMSFFIAIGVVIVPGAAVGLMWQNRGMPSRPRSRNCCGHHDRQHGRDTPGSDCGPARTRQPDRLVT